ncbi:hypothetical protein GQ53DRAFT_732494 [Thozetella sp. PMI_491]|nr:hypothetical protein GQ53DRAFT_732494 [Thozetella sp. PMI_491]
MSSGSRSRTGCYTCRIRKKKCDEQRPSCGGCKSRNLHCYGYDTPPPDWMQGKRNWKEVTTTEEARQLQSIAEAKYKARRRYGQQGLEATATQTPTFPHTHELTLSGRHPSALGSIWWDGGFCDTLPDQKSPRADAPLVTLYLSFIFPIQFSFYSLSTPADQAWVMSGLCSNKARYHAALSVSACFQASLREPEKTDGIGLSLEVAERQATASSALQAIITCFNQGGHTPRDVARLGGQVLEVMHQFLSLEVFSMLEGTWQLHHQATMTVLDTLYTYDASHLSDQPEKVSQLSPLDMALEDFSDPEIQRTFEFHVTCAIWIDVIANATFGFPPHTLRRFDYLPYLRTNCLKTQGIMGCHSPVMASIAEITCLADWKTTQLQTQSLDEEELFRRAASVAAGLEDQVRELNQQSSLHTTKLEQESRLVSLQFAYAAQAYLHVVVYGADIDHPELASMVSQNLQMLETLPHRPMIRVHWAFTIAGCLAGSSLHDRFRGLIAKLRAQKLPLGLTWKGLLVMEECWRLRQSQPELAVDCDWKMAMKSLGKRVLLV